MPARLARGADWGTTHLRNDGPGVPMTTLRILPLSRVSLLEDCDSAVIAVTASVLHTSAAACLWANRPRKPSISVSPAGPPAPGPGRMPSSAFNPSNRLAVRSQVPSATSPPLSAAFSELTWVRRPGHIAPDARPGRRLPRSRPKHRPTVNLRQHPRKHETTP